MKKIHVVIDPHQLDNVRDAVIQVGVEGMTVSEVRTLGATKDRMGCYRGASFALDFAHKVGLEMVVTDGELERVIEAIRRAARLHAGDAVLSVSVVEDVLRIRTGEHGEMAIHPRDPVSTSRAA